MTDRPDFEGNDRRECGEHRTVGPHRAWCHDCSEWCYPEDGMGCRGCLLPGYREQIGYLREQVFRIQELCEDDLRGDDLVAVDSIRRALNGPR